MSGYERECAIHGIWKFLKEETAQQFGAQHADCKWPVSTRRFPAKSRKRALS